MTKNGLDLQTISIKRTTSKSPDSYHDRPLCIFYFLSTAQKNDFFATAPVTTTFNNFDDIRNLINN